MNVLTGSKSHLYQSEHSEWQMAWNKEFRVLVPHCDSTPTHSFLPVCECVAKKSDSCFTSSLVTEFSVVWLMCIPKTQDSIEGREIQWYYHNQSKISRCPYHFSSSLLFEMLRMMVHLLELLCKLPRRLVWTGQHCLQGKCYWYGAVSSQCKLRSGQHWSRLLLLHTLILFE